MTDPRAALRRPPCRARHQGGQRNDDDERGQDATDVQQIGQGAHRGTSLTWRPS